MTILKLAQLGDSIMALYADGYLRAWNLSACQRDRQRINLVPSSLEIFLSRDVQSMQCWQGRVIAYALYAVDFEPSTLQYMPYPTHTFFRNEKEQITAMVALNVNQLLVGSSKGHLYKFQWQNKKSSRVYRAINERQLKSSLGFFFSQETELPNRVTALVHLLQNNQIQAFVGYSDGSISKHNLNANKDQANQNFHKKCLKTEEQPVVALKLNPPAKQLYSLHQTCILVWDIHQPILIYVIDIYRPVDVLFARDDRTVVVNQSCHLTHLSIVFSQAIVRVSHSSEAAQAAAVVNYEGGEFVVVGGSTGLVDLFSQERQVAVCFASKQS